jgi:hypothetical protein
VGINLIVLDDGWFGRRDDDTSSLGDWVADLSKFPQGIKGLAEDVNAAGCKFGIWFEPEMVSEESVRRINVPSAPPRTDSRIKSCVYFVTAASCML